MGIFKDLLKETFKKTKNNIQISLQNIFSKNNELNYEEFEEILIKNDFGAEFSEQIIDEIKKNKDINNQQELINYLKHVLINKINQVNNFEIDKNKLTIIQIIGVNGSGKTTTIGKLTNYFNQKKYKILIASCDTFRAAANEQLKKWANQSNVDIIEDFSKDPAAVAFEAIKTAKENDYNIVFVDTAGRLHTNKNLMLELQKIDNVISKSIDNNTKRFNILVVDGNSGQNANNQYYEFSKYVKVDGLIITKLDGTSKGGSVFQISAKNKIPILFLGIGEGKENIIEFNIEDYVSSILE